MTPEQGTSRLADRPPISDLMGPHAFVESEFEEGAGRCDKCGGGPDAEIHQEPVDNLKRIADALEEIAGALYRIEDRFHESTEPMTDEPVIRIPRGSLPNEAKG